MNQPATLEDTDLSATQTARSYDNILQKKLCSHTEAQH